MFSASSVSSDGRQVNCGLIGVGVVGSAVLDFFADGPRTLRLSGPGLESGASVPIHIWSASRRSRSNPRAASEALIQRVTSQAGGDGPRFFYDQDASSPEAQFKRGVPAWRRIVSDPNVDIVVELTGSAAAEAIIREALWNGKSVVTASKRVISRSGYELVKLAQARGCVLAYEGSVGGGMPIVQMMGASIGGRITAFLAIINGTTNFILSRMREAALSLRPGANGASTYPAALCAATHAGLAEADPSDDVLGEDPRSKLIILAGLAFGVRLRPADVYVRGIARRGRRTLPEGLPRSAFHACPGKAPCQHLCAQDDHLATEAIFTAADVRALSQLGYAPKLLAGAQRIRDHGEHSVVGWVQPTAVPLDHPLAGVQGPENACLLQVESPVTGGQPRQYPIMVRGPGAGGPETASSVIADIDFCASQLAVAGRVGGRADPSGPVPVYMYGAAAFSQSQAYRGIPSLLLAQHLRMPFFLRFTLQEAPSRSRQVILDGLAEAGVAVRPATGDGMPSGGFYLVTEPVSVASMERALESTLQRLGPARLGLDVLYLPIISGAGLTG